MENRTKKTRVNKVTKKKEVKYEGDRFWVEEQK